MCLRGRHRIWYGLTIVMIRAAAVFLTLSGVGHILTPRRSAAFQAALVTQRMEAREEVG
jgi:hypothetical protein